MEVGTVNQVATDIAGLMRKQVGLMPKGTALQVTDSITGGKKLVSVALRDSGGYPLFAINVDLPGGANTLRQTLRKELSQAY